MTKVWVPIELPDGFSFFYGVVKGGKDDNTSIQVHATGPVLPYDLPANVAPPTHLKVEPQRERWEYLIVAAAELGDGGLKPSAGQRGCNSFGALGWECFHVNPGTVWFKRRLP